MSDLTAVIAGMPKSKLHVDIDGTLEPEMTFHLARRKRVKLPYKHIKARKVADDCNDPPSFLVGYYEGMRALLTEQDFFDVAFASLTKAGSQDVRDTEMFFDP